MQGVWTIGMFFSDTIDFCFCLTLCNLESSKLFFCLASIFITATKASTKQDLLLQKAYHFLVIGGRIPLKQSRFLFRCFSAKWINKTCDATEELGFGHVQKLFRSLLAYPVLNFLRKEHFRNVKWCACRTSLACSVIPSRFRRKTHLIDIQFPEIIMIGGKFAGKDGWTRLESILSELKVYLLSQYEPHKK